VIAAVSAFLHIAVQSTHQVVKLIIARQDKMNVLFVTFTVYDPIESTGTYFQPPDIPSFSLIGNKPHVTDITSFDNFFYSIIQSNQGRMAKKGLFQSSYPVTTKELMMPMNQLGLEVPWNYNFRSISSNFDHLSFSSKICSELACFILM
jgi:hypothetical protein